MLELPLSLLRSLPSLVLSVTSGSALSIPSGSWLALDGSAAGVTPTRGIRYSPSAINFATSGGIGILVQDGAPTFVVNGQSRLGNDQTNFLTVSGSATTPSIVAGGGGASIGIALTPVGTGTVQPSSPIDWKTPGQYTDNSGTPGNTTISKVTGRAAIASGASACVVTNTLVSATSIVFAFCETIGVGVADLVCVPGAGSFTVTSVSATGVATVTTGNLKFSFIIFNV